MSRKKSAPVAIGSEEPKPTYTDLFATCVRPSRMIDSLNKTITKFVSGNDTILDVWSFSGEPHSVALGTKALLRCAHMPDGKVFYNLQ